MAQALSSYGGTNNPMTTAANSQIMADLSGQYLDPATNPTLAPTVKAIESEAQTNLGANLASIAGANNAGGMSISTKLPSQQMQAAEQSQQNVTNQVANLYNQNYTTERANQIQAIGQAVTAGQLPLDTAMSLAQLIMSGQGTTDTSGYQLGGATGINIGSEGQGGLLKSLGIG